MVKLQHLIYLILIILLLGACNTTKNVPEGSYLLNSVKIKTDTKHASSGELESFVRQQPNSTIGLMIYNIAGQDTTKWLNRKLQSWGQAPVIFSNKQTGQTMLQLSQNLNNLGYLRAEVDTTIKTKDKKLDLTYNIKGGERYTIRNYDYAITDTTILYFLKKNPFKTNLAPGGAFTVENMEQEKDLVSQLLRIVGYYNFSKEFIYFKADTTLNSNQVDLWMDIYPQRDSVPYTRYRINDVKIISGYNPFDSEIVDNWLDRNADTTRYHNMQIIRGPNKFLRNSTINRKNFIKPGNSYSDYNTIRTYDGLRKLGAVKQVTISYEPNQKDSLHLLDATITITPSNFHWFKASLEGTHSGTIGVAPSLSYQHQNLFNGAEQLAFSLKGSYEFNTNRNSNLSGKNYFEIGGDLSLTFPQFVFPFLKRSIRDIPSASTRFSIGLTTQHRKEYTRQFFNGTIDYSWLSKSHRFQHSLSFIDINYVHMPPSSISDEFKEDFLEDPSNPLLKASYADQLIARTSYNLTFSNPYRYNSLKPTYTVRTSIEHSGLLPRIAESLGLTKTGSEGKQQIMGVNYAEYVKGTIDYSKTHYLSKKRSIAYHAVLGVAYPYGNSDVMPFERRFSAGGPNSIRGWSSRSLGPGSYKSTNRNADFVNQSGDIKLEFSIESRHKMSKMFEFATFLDAGNIWTLKKYDSQAGGQFKFDSFYKEIAVAYGIGLRLDLDFLLLRLDFGARIYDPGEDQSDRFVMFSPRWRRTAWHFGIGYPF